MNWKNFLTSGHTFSEDELELKLQYMLFNLLILSNMAFALILLIVRIFQGSVMQTIVNGSYLLFAATILYLARRNKAYFGWIVTVVIAVSYLFATVIFYYLFNEISGVSWYILLVIVGVIFRGRTTALILFSLSVLSILWIAIEHHHLPVDTVISGLVPFASSLFIVLIFDVFQKNMRKMIEAQKEKYVQLSRRDVLVDIPNRAYFFDYFSNMLERVRQDRDAPGFALLFVDVDHFKMINDRFGHTVGDVVLLEVGKRFKRRLRRGDMVARYGGDEFAVLISEIHTPEALRTMLDRLVTDMKKPFSVEDKCIDVSLSIGAVMIPQDGIDEVELIRAADQAMYAAKKEPGNSYRFYRELMESHAREHLEGHWSAWRAS